MAVPLMALYEVSVQAVRFLESRRRKREAAKGDV
jgi:Sec-independent protein secretion pathway component TatC